MLFATHYKARMCRNNDFKPAFFKYHHTYVTPMILSREGVCVWVAVVAPKKDLRRGLWLDSRFIPYGNLAKHGHCGQHQSISWPFFEIEPHTTWRPQPPDMAIRPQAGCHTTCLATSSKPSHTYC